MEKVFKYFCLFMTAIIIISSFGIVVTISKNEKQSDFLACNEIVNNIKNYKLNMTSIIYVKNDNDEWEEYQRIHGDENRIWVDIEQIPQTLIDAFICIEDQRFYTHTGIDWKRTTAAFVNYLPFVNLYSSNQGGSTITQQLIKNITSDNDKSAARKVREIARAFLIEKMVDKTTILEAYLNTISLGNGICGVQVAANYYFNKDVKDLTLVECASLAAITKNPSAYNPISKPKGNKDRRNDVLFKMYELNKISKKEYLDSVFQEVVVDDTQQKDFEIPINNYFVDALISDVIKDLSEKYNCSDTAASAMLYNGGYKIYATIDTKIQDTMEEVYLDQKNYFSLKSSKDKSVNVQSSMTIMDYNGNILGIVGGVGEKTVNRGLNRAVDSPRQPGSTMKPLGVYVQAIDNGYASYSTVIEDKPIDNYKDGKKGPKEWYGYYAGNMTVKEALERSANTIPCWLLKDHIGIDNSYNFLTEKLNLEHLTDIDKNLSSLALGGCQYGVTTTESAAAYAIFGNGGKYYEPTTYFKVLDVDDQLILQPKQGEQVIKEETATIMNKLLQNVVYGPQGTGRGISGYSKMKAYAKTGTSSESKDLWMVAGTPYYVGSVWFGFDQPENVKITNGASKVWNAIMKKLHKDLEIKEFELSETVVEAQYCEATGKLALPSCENKSKGYYISDVEIETCTGEHPEPETEAEEGEETSSETPSEDASSDVSSSEESSEESLPSEESSTTEEGDPSSEEGTTEEDGEGDDGDGNEDNETPSEDTGSTDDELLDENSSVTQLETP